VELIAAIDLLDGRSVRLREGDYERRVESGADPSELAARWATAGVPRLHIVDLEGARAGEPRQLARLGEVVRAAREAAPAIGVQAGGGLRAPEAVAAVLDAGVDAAVLGTVALERPGFLASCAARWPGRVLAALDLRDGRLALDGWRRVDDADPLSTAGRLLDEGAAGLLVTDTRRDGMLAGPNLELLATFRKAFPQAWLVAAGGIRSTDDLLDLQRAGLDGAIVGLAMLTGDLGLRDALAALAASAMQP
jgi:phosphoribosylformimino-5-aminoimidazole carboxamide ribotide isomerase